MTRLERHLRKSPGEKSLGPTIGGAPRNTNPFTARDADLDLVVLEDIATINFGRGVPDPTPGGTAEKPSAPRLRSPFYATNEDFAVAAMSGPNRRRSFSGEKDPSNMGNPDGHFPGPSGPMWRDTSFAALHVAPRARRGTSPASVNTYLHAEHTETYWDAVRDDTGVWNSPPPPEMEVERAIYDAMKRETIDVGGYSVPFPRHPKESDYYQETDSTGATVRRLRATRSFPFRDRENFRWTDGHPLYHATPTGSLPKIMAEGLVASAERQLWFGASPTVWNEQFPHNAPILLKSPVKGMSFLRISPTQTMNEKLSSLAKAGSADRATPSPSLAIDSAGNAIEPRDSRTQPAVGLFADALFFNDLKIPTENIEVLSQTGEWIPLYKTDLSDVVPVSPSGPEAGMANEDNRGIRKILAGITNGEHGGDEGADEQKPASNPPAEVPVVVPMPSPEPRIKYSDSYGGDDLIKNEQRIQRIEHEGLVAAGRWNDIHGDHYDWWAYPIDRGSSLYGETFNVAGEPIRRLKEDPEFLASLAREIEIQALALGWSLYDKDWVEKLDWENGQDWQRAYPTRLWKATRSAQIFGLQREFESMLALHDSLEAGGVRFNHETYWESPGTVDDVPSLGKSWKDREEERRQRYAASDAASWTSPYRSQPQGPKQGSDDSQMTLLEEDRVWDAYDSYTTPVFPVVSDAEELADILSEPDEMIEFGYPYERIDKETRQLIADDIFFAVSLLMDGEFPDEEFTDRLESAEQMRRYADEQEGLYPDDGDILYALADALENPVSLYEDAVYESTDSPDGEAGMARKNRQNLTKDFKDRVIALRDEGNTRKEIGEKLGLTTHQVDTVMNAAIRSGEAKPGITSPEKKRELIAQVAKMLNDGIPPRKIAEELGLPLSRVSGYQYVARKQGLLTKPRRRTKAEMDELVREAARLYNEGRRGDMSKEMNLDEGTISNLLIRANKLNLLRDYNPKGGGNFRKTVRTPKNIAAVADRYRQGKTIAQITEELGFSYNTVKGLLREARLQGLDTGGPRQRSSDQMDELSLEVATRYEEGKTIPAIARELGVDHSLATNLVERAKQLGLIRRDRVERATAVADELMRQVTAKLREGKTRQEIAQELNINRMRVDNLVKRARAMGESESPDDPSTRTGGSDGEAGMGRRFRGMDEEPDYSDMSLSDTEIQNFIESEADKVTDDLIFGREVSRAFAQEEDEPVPRSVVPVRQISVPTLEDIPEDLKQSYIRLWAGGGSFVAINRQLGISNHDGAAIQTALLRSGEILPRTKLTPGDSLRLTPEDEKVFVEWSNEGADMDLLTSVFGLTAGQAAEIAADLRSRGLIRRRFQKNFFTDSERDAFATIVKEELEKGRGIWLRSVLRAQRELGWSKQRANAMLLWFKRQVKFGHMPGIRTQLSDSDMMRFAARWNDGVPEEQLAREFNVAKGSVKWLASKARKRGMRLKGRNSTDFSATDKLRRSPSLSREWLSGVENGTISGGYEEFVEGMQKRAAALYRDGKTYAEIARELRVNGSDAKYLIDRAATSGDMPKFRRGRKPKVAIALGITTDELVERVAARYNEGRTGAEMAAEFGTTIGTLSYFLKVAGKRGLLKFGKRRKKPPVKRNVTGASSRKTRPIDGSDGEAGMSGPDSVDLPDGIDEELKDHAYEDPVFGLSIKHPLFFWIAPINPEVTDLINASFAKKRASADEALRQKNWGRYIYLHERPYRIDAFEDVMDEMTDQEYWSRLSDIWVDSENIGAQPDRWRDLLLSDRGSRQSFMTDDELAEFAALQPRFTVYRGYSENDQEEFGMSWSTDAGVAEWFARRFAREDDKIFMEEMEVSKDDVFAYLTRRGEEEIILDMRTATGGTASRRQLKKYPNTTSGPYAAKLRKLGVRADGEAGMSRRTERGDLVRLGRNSNYPSGLQPGSLGRVARVGRDGTISVEIEGELIKLTPGEDHFLVIPRQFDVLYELTDNDGNVMYLPVEDVTYPRLTSAREEAAKAGYRETGIIRGNMRTFFDDATGTYKTERTEFDAIGAQNIRPETTAPVTRQSTDTPDGEAGMSSRKIPKFNGGHSSRGRGTPSGDGKDQAMRDVADSAIVELANDERSSSRTTLETLGSYRAGSMVVMLARNGELRGLPLRDETIQAITNAHENGATFVVGDMPGVDSQFVDYLEKIGADYTIYHAGSSPRFSPQPPDALGAAPPEILARATDDEAQLNLLYSVPGVAASVRIRDTDGRPTVPGKNAIMKPYLLAPHIDVNDLDASDPAIQSLLPALKAAGLGSYKVTGSTNKIQGPVVREFADRLIGPSAVADAVLGTFPTADEMLTIYAVNALIRARAEYLADSVFDADQVNEAILFGNHHLRGPRFPKDLWEKAEIGRSMYLDPFSYFGDDSNFLKAVIDALPERVRSGLAFSPAEKETPGVTREDRSWGDTSHFESIIIREDDDISRRFAPMVRRQAAIVVDHARRHEQLAKKWAQTAYDLMREAGLTDAEVAFVINEHWAKASTFKLATVQPGNVLGHAARLGVKAFSSRYSPISRAVTRRIENVQPGGLVEEEDFGLHEFFHHYLGQGFTRHGEYVAFRGPTDLIDSYHGHMQWAWNDTGQLGMFVTRVMLREFGLEDKPDERTFGPPRALFDTIGRAIYDRLKEMLSSAEDRRRIMDQVFPEFHGSPSEDEAKIKQLIRRQFAVRDSSARQFADFMPVLRLLTVQDLLVPKMYYPYGGTSKITGGSN